MLSLPAAYDSQVSDPAHSDAPAVLDPAVPVDPSLPSFWFQYVLLLSRLLTGLLQIVNSVWMWVYILLL
jgi:hypothetical protein